MTHVDRCEREPAAAWRANADGPERLAQACEERGFRLVHVSTDYVFAGAADRPYREDDPPAPASEYGRSKLEGERRVLSRCASALVVRTSWVFGRGRNFVAAILAQAQERRRQGDLTPLKVVDDQRGRPTYAVDLAAGIQPWSKPRPVGCTMSRTAVRRRGGTWRGPASTRRASATSKSTVSAPRT